MRRLVAPRGRPPKQGEILSIERAIKFAPSMYESLDARSRETGITVAELIRRAIAADLAGTVEPPPTPENVLTLELPPDLYSKLTAFAKTKAIKNLPDFIEHLALRALEVKPSTFHKFFYDDADDAADALAMDRANRKTEQPKKDTKAA